METNSHNASSVHDCRIIQLPRNKHENGSLSVVQNDKDSPFAIKRIFYIYDVPGDSERGGHSHHIAQELIIAVAGCFDVTLNDGKESVTFTLRRPYQALYIPAGIWRSMNNFSSGSVCLVLTSEKYSENDYVRDFNKFLKLTEHKIKR